jgi:hypothetical protein
MNKYWVPLLILISPGLSKADKSFFNPQPVQSEFVLYLPDLVKQFDAIISGKDKCSQESYRKMERILSEIYIWYHFQNSIESLVMLNTLTSKLEEVEGLQPGKRIYEIDDALPDGDEVTQEQVIDQLNLWRQRECTVLGKGKTLWNKVIHKN